MNKPQPLGFEPRASKRTINDWSGYCGNFQDAGVALEFRVKHMGPVFFFDQCQRCANRPQSLDLPATDRHWKCGNTIPSSEYRMACKHGHKWNGKDTDDTKCPKCGERPALKDKIEKICNYETGKKEDACPKCGGIGTLTAMWKPGCKYEFQRELESGELGTASKMVIMFRTKRIAGERQIPRPGEKKTRYFCPYCYEELSPNLFEIENYQMGFCYNCTRKFVEPIRYRPWTLWGRLKQLFDIGFRPGKAKTRDFYG